MPDWNASNRISLVGVLTPVREPHSPLSCRKPRRMQVQSVACLRPKIELHTHTHVFRWTANQKWNFYHFACVHVCVFIFRKGKSWRWARHTHIHNRPDSIQTKWTLHMCGGYICVAFILAYLTTKLLELSPNIRQCDEKTCLQFHLIVIVGVYRKQ